MGMSEGEWLMWRVSVPVDRTVLLNPASHVRCELHKPSPAALPAAPSLRRTCSMLSQAARAAPVAMAAWLTSTTNTWITGCGGRTCGQRMAVGAGGCSWSGKKAGLGDEVAQKMKASSKPRTLLGW